MNKNIIRFIRVFIGVGERPAVVLVRSVLLATIFTAMVSAGGGLLNWPHGAAWGWFSLFALLSAWNFWGLTNFVGRAISAGWTKGAGIRTFLNTQLRLFFTGFLVYGALVWWSVPVIVLLGGLTVSLFWAALFGLLGTGTSRT